MDNSSHPILNDMAHSHVHKAACDLDYQFKVVDNGTLTSNTHLILVPKCYSRDALSYLWLLNTSPSRL
ncbi:unnamed protein product [Alternaria burnsii]|nr:unnamed protein product [Alternaria burnsii]